MEAPWSVGGIADRRPRTFENKFDSCTDHHAGEGKWGANGTTRRREQVRLLPPVLLLNLARLVRSWLTRSSHQFAPDDLESLMGRHRDEADTVRRALWEREAAGSIPVISTDIPRGLGLGEPPKLAVVSSILTRGAKCWYDGM